MGCEHDSPDADAGFDSQSEFNALLDVVGSTTSVEQSRKPTQPNNGGLPHDGTHKKPGIH
jgi:hypothetical protein